MAQLYSLEVERHSLSGFFKHPEIYPEVDAVMSEYDYYSETHRTIFAVIRSVLSKGEKLDKVIVAQKIKNLGYKPKDDIDIFSYLDALAGSQITAKGALDACKELVKFRVRREINKTADQIKDFVAKNGELKIDELVAQADKIYNDKINSYQIDEEPVDLYEGIKELVLARGANPMAEIGLVTPYPEFNRMLGGIRSGNGLYAVTSRPKHGKSSWLLNMAEGVTMLNEDTIVLYLDTEMQTEVEQFRIASANSDVPMWYLETGNWSKNADLAQKIQKNIDNFDKLKNRVFHMKVANRPIEQICSLVRRFYYKRVGRVSGRRLMVIYDYIKLTGEKITNNWAEHQAVGEKINYLNDIGSELDLYLWAAMQLNRSAEDGRDDSAAVATSDRLQWFCAFSGIFRRKTLDEIAEDGFEFGSHKLIPLAKRFEGKDSAGHHDLVKVTFKKKEKPKYKQNFINFNLNNFRVSEHGTLINVVNRQREIYELSKDSQLDDAHV